MLVVNHTLYCSHLASEGHVLPEHDVVIIDEAHAFPDNATNAFAGDLTTDTLRRLCGMLARAGTDRQAVDALAEVGKHLATVIEHATGTIDVASDAELGDVLISGGERLAAASAKFGDSRKRLRQAGRAARRRAGSTCCAGWRRRRRRRRLGRAGRAARNSAHRAGRGGGGDREIPPRRNVR